MIDTDKYEGHEKKLRLDEGTYLQIVVPPNRPVGVWNKWEGVLLFDLGEKAAMGNTCVPTARLMADAPLILEAYKELQSQYEQLKEVLIGDSPNWTHDELVEEALELAILNHNLLLGNLRDEDEEE